MFCLCAYSRILKVYQVYFHKKKKKLHLFRVLKCKMGIITSLSLSIRVWTKYKKTITIILFVTLGISYI